MEKDIYCGETTGIANFLMDVLGPYRCVTLKHTHPHTHPWLCWAYTEARQKESPLIDWVRNGENPGIAFRFTQARHNRNHQVVHESIRSVQMPPAYVSCYTHNPTTTQRHTHTPPPPAGAGPTHNQPTTTLRNGLEPHRARAETPQHIPENDSGGQTICLRFNPKKQGRALFPQRNRSRSTTKTASSYSRILHD